MNSFKDFFYLKEDNESRLGGFLKNIKNRVINDEIDFIYLSNLNLFSLPDLTFIKKVKKDFKCNNNNLSNLVGSPKYIGRYFSCNYNDSLETLEGGPEIVIGDFYCSSNNSLYTLKGGPKKIGGHFLCCNNHKLTSLEGAPEKVGGDFSCSDNNKLTSLEGAPKIVGGDFYCNNCPNIQEDQWQYLPIIGGTLITNKNLNRNELLTLQRLKALGRIGGLELTGHMEEFEDDDPFNLI